VGQAASAAGITTDRLCKDLQDCDDKGELQHAISLRLHPRPWFPTTVFDDFNSRTLYSLLNITRFPHLFIGWLALSYKFHFFIFNIEFTKLSPEISTFFLSVLCLPLKLC